MQARLRVCGRPRAEPGSPLTRCRQDIRYYSLVTFPRPERISSVLKSSYRKLARIDPRNDSQVIFYDQVIPGSDLIAYVNADHWALVVPVASVAHDDRLDVRDRERLSARSAPRGRAAFRRGRSVDGDLDDGCSSVAVVLALSCATGPAFAWVYPEHRDIAVLGIESLDPDRKALFDRLWAEARINHEKRLCAQGADTAQRRAAGVHRLGSHVRDQRRPFVLEQAVARLGQQLGMDPRCRRRRRATQDRSVAGLENGARRASQGWPDR